VTPDDEAVGLLAETAAAPPPPALADLVLRAATTARPSGQVIEALGGGHRADPAAAFVQTVEEFRAVLATADGMAIVEPYGWSVSQLVAHLTEVDLYFGRQLGLWQHDIDETHEDDHLAMTQHAVRGAVRADLATTCATWLDVSSGLCAHVATLDAEQQRTRIKFHMLDTRISTALVARVFEVWTHTEDLCRAVRRDPPPLDIARLHLMTGIAVNAIPFGMLLGNLDAGAQTARVVLTGRGGGVWNQPLQLGMQAGEPAVTIVVDSLEFCRLAAQRIAPVDVNAEIEGSQELALTVLRGASVFAA